MKIIEPSVGLWKQGDDVKAHVAKCARVCYGKETGNDDVTINTLLKKHHWSMFRHESVYVIGEFTSRLAIALDGILTGRYFDICYIKECQIKSGSYIPFNTIKLKGTKVEIKEFIAIMTIDCENSDLIRLSNLYDIDWKITNAFKDKNIKNITIRDYNKYRNDNK